MPILTTTTISRKKLQEIINFGRKKKVITPKQAADLTISVNKNSNIAQSNSFLTIGEARKIKQIDLKDDQLHKLIMIQEKRIQHELKGPLTFREAMPYAGMGLSIPILYVFFLAAAIAVPVVALALATFGYFACITLIGVSCYHFFSQPSLSTLERTLATLKKFDFSATHSSQTPQSFPNENSSKNHSEFKKTQHSPSHNFFPFPPTSTTSQDVDSFTDQKTPQYRN